MTKPDQSRTERAEFALRAIERLGALLGEIAANPRPPSPDSCCNPGLYSVFESLKVTVDVLDLFPQLRGEGPGAGLTRPLHDLLVAMTDLEDGHPSPLFRVDKPRNEKGEICSIPVRSGVHYQSMIAGAAIALDTLMLSGEKSDRAAVAIVNEIQGVSLGEGDTRQFATTKTVKGWRAELSANNGPYYAQKLWNTYSKQRSIAIKNPTSAADYSMGRLRKFVRQSVFRISP